MAAKEESMGLKYKKSQDFSEWYDDVVLKTELADHAPISGCMVIRPYAYQIWENIQKYFDSRIKETGHKNAYFPLFIPERFLHKEADHFKGFVPEVAFVEMKEKNEERYALRPTSETIIYDSYSRWIRSWRNLPLLINQWCNIVRWEVKATRLFLRTREFLWQEGHTAHETKEDADREVTDIMGIYTDLAEKVLAVPVLVGRRTEADKFAGALYTLAMESLMPDGKVLQMGTSHNLGQNFSKPFGVKFRDRNEKDQYVWQTSWGVSTRLIGALVMAHGDDKGLVVPPKIAPIQAVIVPIIFEKDKEKIISESRKLEKELSGSFRVELDLRDYTAGWKFNEWEMKGVPLRIELGPKDIEKKQVVVVRRDTGEKKSVSRDSIEKEIASILESMQASLLEKARKMLKDNTEDAKNKPELKKLIEKRKLVRAGWCGSEKCEESIQKETAATIRLIPLRKEKPPGDCVYCGKKPKETVYIAKAY